MSFEVQQLFSHNITSLKRLFLKFWWVCWIVHIFSNFNHLPFDKKYLKRNQKKIYRSCTILREALIGESWKFLKLYLSHSWKFCSGIGNQTGFLSVRHVQSGLFIWVGPNISALVGCIKKLRALYEVQLLEKF